MTLTLAILQDAARDAGVEITIADAGRRPYRLIQRGRGTRAFASPRNLYSGLLYLASLRAVVRNFAKLQTPAALANPDSPENWALYNTAIGKEA